MHQVYPLCGIEERDFLEGPGAMFLHFAGAQGKLSQGITPPLLHPGAAAEALDRSTTSTTSRASHRQEHGREIELQPLPAEDVRVNVGVGGRATRSGYGVARER